MPVKNYVNVNGRTIAERTGGVRTSYLTDALGSVTATVNSSQVVVNTYRWKPYGSLLAKTGVGADPTLGWVGTHGYRRTQRSRSEYYMLARHYDSIGGRWTTVDPLWPTEPAFAYVTARPTSSRDPSGLYLDFGQTGRGCTPEDQNDLNVICSKLTGSLGHYLAAALHACLLAGGHKNSTLTDAVNYVKYLKQACGASKKICIHCFQDGVPPDDWPCQCPHKCKPGMAIGAAGYVLFTEHGMVPVGDTGLNPNYQVPVPKGCESLQADCDCVIVSCKRGFVSGNRRGVVLHELMHCPGLFHQPNTGPIQQEDYVHWATACLMKILKL